MISLACWLYLLFFYSFLLTDLFIYLFICFETAVFIYIFYYLVFFPYLSWGALSLHVTVSYSGYWLILLRITNAFGSYLSTFIAQGESEIININGLWRTNSAEVNVLVLVLNEHFTVLIFLKQSWRSLVLSFTYVYFSQVYHILIYKLASFWKLHSIVCIFPPLIVNGRNYQQLAN